MSTNARALTAEAANLLFKSNVRTLAVWGVSKQHLTTCNENNSAICLNTPVETSSLNWIPPLQPFFLSLSLSSPVLLPPPVSVLPTAGCTENDAKDWSCSSQIIDGVQPASVWMWDYSDIFPDMLNPWVSTCGSSGCHCKVVWLEQWVTSYKLWFL